MPAPYEGGQALEAARVGTWAWEIASGALTLSPEGEALLGLTGAERARFEDFLALVHPEDRSGVQATAEAAARDGGAFDIEFRVAAAEGDPRWLRSKGRPRLDANGRPARLLGILIEIDERKRIEAAAATLAAIVLSSDAAIIGKTLDGIITSWNRGAEQIFGYAPAEIIGKPVSILAPATRQNEMLEILARIRAGERLEHFETERRAKDGRVLQVTLSVSPVLDGAGRIVGVSKVIHDITPLKRAEARMQELQSELAHVARLSEMGQMSSALAHELNQPLMAATNYLNASRRVLQAAGENSTAKTLEALHKAGEQIERASEIIRRLRSFAKKGEVERRAEDLSQVIEEANALAMVGTKSLGLMLRLDLDPRARIAVIDRVQIQQVVVNLVRNAIEAMAQSERRQLTVSTAPRDADHHEICVADTGPGLPASVAAELFKPFVTTKEGGVGIGLSICRAIIEAHGGRIWVDANPGGGTQFRFTVPAGEESRA